MRAVIQRVKQASVSVDNEIVGQIQKGILIFLAIAKEDQSKDIDYMVKKISHLRIFEDADGKMNLSLIESAAEILVVSQFTLYGDCRKGRRPSFDKAASPKKGEAMYHQFVAKIREVGLKTETGTFQAMMDVSLVNDGPVTFIVDSI